MNSRARRSLTVVSIITCLLAAGWFPEVAGPDSQAGSQPGGSIGVDVVYPRVERCELWNETGFDVDWGTSDDTNATNTQVDVGTSNEYYIWVNVSHAGGASNISSVSVYGWFDYGVLSYESTSGYNATPGGNLNFLLEYNSTSNVSTLRWPLSGELSLAGTVNRTFSTWKDVAFRVRFGDQVRWAPGPPEGFNMTRGINDLFTWNMYCDAYDKDGNPALTKGENEFGTYKLTTLSIANSPSGSAVPGGGLTLLQVGNPQYVDYSSNSPYILRVNISDLTGVNGTFRRQYIAIEGEDLSAPVYFPQDSGVRYLRGGENDTWENMTPSLPVHPTPRTLQGGLAYDSESDRIILFGGTTGSGYNNETWAYDHNTNTWTNMSPFPAPSPRTGTAMAYDSQSDRVILFGGQDGASSYFNETWAYDYNTNTWSNMTLFITAPSPRTGTAMAYDSQSDRVILFGGFNGAYLGDTWAYDYDTNTWTYLSTQGGPSARYHHAMAYDSQSDRLILFGGEYAGFSYSNDTWAYDYNKDTWSNMTPSTSPPARSWHALAYDSQSDRLILFGGYYYYSGTNTYLGDTWAYDYNTNIWTNMSPSAGPSRRYGHAMAYDIESGHALMFGGWNTSGYLDDVWGYDLAANTWVWMNPPFRGRYGHTFAYDWKNRLSVAYGGSTGTGSLSETWVYDMSSSSWRYAAPFVSPGARAGHTMVYDISLERFVMFGGVSGTGAYLNDTWTYDVSTNTWTNMSPPSSPSPRKGHAMAYNMSGGYILLFGGRNATTYFDDTWRYDLSTNTWTRLYPVIRPTRRGYAGLDHVEVQKFILFGGVGNSGVLGDTWAYDPAKNNWSNLNPSRAPSARRSPGLVFDVSAGRLMLFGGFSGTGYASDTWVYSVYTNEWYNVTRAFRPAGREQAGPTFDIHTGKMLLFGGWGGTALNDTWAFTGRDWRVENDGTGLFSREIYWYVSVPFGQAPGSYTSPITYTIGTASSPIAA